MSQRHREADSTQDSHTPMVSLTSTTALMSFLATRDRTRRPLLNQLYAGDYRLDCQPRLFKSNGGYPIDGVDQGARVADERRVLIKAGDVYLD